jgi:hypothetical protein
MVAPVNTSFVQGQGSVGADQLNSFTQTVLTAANLRAWIGVTGNTAFLQGIEAVGDGLGGLFYWDGAATAPDNNLNVIVPTGQFPGAWLRDLLVVDSVVDPDFSYLGSGPPGSNKVIGLYTFAGNVTFESNFANSYGTCLVLPTNIYTVFITKNGSNIGTMTIATSGAFSFASSGGAPVSYGFGDYMSFVAPGTTDATINNFSWTMRGTLIP